MNFLYDDLFKKYFNILTKFYNIRTIKILEIFRLLYFSSVN